MVCLISLLAVGVDVYQATQGLDAGVRLAMLNAWWHFRDASARLLRVLTPLLERLWDSSVQTSRLITSVPCTLVLTLASLRLRVITEFGADLCWLLTDGAAGATG